MGCPERDLRTAGEIPAVEQMPTTPFPLMESLVLLGRRGSEAHGTWIAPEDPNGIDDRDLMGICIPPALWTMSLRHWEGADAIKGVWDVVLYDFRKFVRLLCNQNPNVLTLLWLEPEDYLLVTSEGRALINARNLFRSREKALEAFSGYAHGQIKKMTSGKFAGYMGDKRKRLVEKFGYDTKNAAHCIRLLHMGEEYQRTGTLTVRRTHDVAMIIDIKRGGWALERVKEYAAECMRKLHDAYEVSVLPDEIGTQAVENIMMEALYARLTMEVLNMQVSKPSTPYPRTPHLARSE
jgi:predicted nucleotidyltransferase